MKGTACPHLGLESSGQQPLPQPSHLYHCFASQHAEPVGIVHQGTFCLTPDHARCLRFASDEPQVAWPDEGAAGLSPLANRAVESSQDAQGATPRRSRRPTLIEVVIFSQALAIALAMGFVLFSIGYRSWVVYGGGHDWIAGATWGVIAAELRAGDTQPVQPGPSPTALPYKTLVPTFTPGPAITGPAPSVLANHSTATPSPTRTATRTPRPTLTPQPERILPTPTRTPGPTRVLPTPTRTPGPTRVLPTPTATPALRPMQASVPPTRLVIPEIKLDSPVEPVGFATVKSRNATKAVWESPADAIGFHDGSAYPGQGGNIVMNGHRDIQGAVFWRLPRVEVGDEIDLYVNDEVYSYHVTELIELQYTGASEEEKAEHLRLMSAMSQERLTLITCTPPVLATHRLYVIAEPPSEAARDRQQVW